MGNRLIISIINLQLCWYFRNRGVNLSVNYRRNINNKDADLASCAVSLPVPRFATSFIRIHLWKQSTQREEDVNEVDGYAWWWYNEIRSGVKFLEAINANRDSWWWSHRLEKRSWRLDSSYLKAFKRSRGKRRRGEPVRHVVGDEQHPLLRGRSSGHAADPGGRWEVRQTRGLIWWPVSSALRPFYGPTLLYPRNALLRRGRQKSCAFESVAPGAVSLSFW